MATVAIILALGVGIVVVAVAAWSRTEAATDLGSVSNTWIAELRAGDPYDSSR